MASSPLRRHLCIWRLSLQHQIPETTRSNIQYVYYKSFDLLLVLGKERVDDSNRCRSIPSCGGDNVQDTLSQFLFPISRTSLLSSDMTYPSGKPASSRREPAPRPSPPVPSGREVLVNPPLINPPPGARYASVSITLATCSGASIWTQCPAGSTWSEGRFR
jgi:hypothetical protein